MLKDISDFLLSLIFPREPLCLICGTRTSFGLVYLCNNCKEALELEVDQARPPMLRSGLKNLRAVGSFAYYHGILKRLVYEFKYRGHRRLDRKLSNMLLEALKDKRWPNFDYIIPVPLHPKREEERGFNQALLLAKPVSKKLGVPLCQELVRVKDTRAQTLLDKNDREKNLRGAFKVRGGQQLQDKTILLIDDVFTTGATAKACAKALKTAGTGDVFMLTVARG